MIYFILFLWKKKSKVEIDSWRGDSKKSLKKKKEKLNQIFSWKDHFFFIKKQNYK